MNDGRRGGLWTFTESTIMRFSTSKLRRPALALLLVASSATWAAAQSTGASSSGGSSSGSSGTGVSASPSGSALTGSSGTPSVTGTIGSTAGASTPNSATRCANADPMDTTAQELGCTQN